MTRTANMRNGQIIECAQHKRKRAWKTRVSKPTNGCVLCWMVYLSDKNDTMLYQDDIENIIAFSNAFPKTIKPSGIEWVETNKDEDE